MATSVYTSLLAKDYKRKLGEIKALRKELRELAKVVIQKEQELSAVKVVLLAREPQFDVAAIKAQSTIPKVLKLKWNQLSILMLSCLREFDGQPVSTAVIADYIVERSGLEVSERLALIQIRASVSSRLKTLASNGNVIRHHAVTSNQIGLWSLQN